MAVDLAMFGIVGAPGPAGTTAVDDEECNLRLLPDGAIEH
jgi:hypothetical protein